MKNVFLATCLILGIVLAACSAEREVVNETDIGPYVTYTTQTCERCGTIFDVLALDGQEIPPTIEWCFHDGGYCEAGLAMLTQSEGQNSSEFIDHCYKCDGCRMAAFTPKQWNELNLQNKE